MNQSTTTNHTSLVANANRHFIPDLSIIVSNVKQQFVLVAQQVINIATIVLELLIKCVTLITIVQLKKAPNAKDVDSLFAESISVVLVVDTSYRCCLKFAEIDPILKIGLR
jgi:hypothetical protein